MVKMGKIVEMMILIALKKGPGALNGTQKKQSKKITIKKKDIEKYFFKIKFVVTSL